MKRSTLLFTMIVIVTTFSFGQSVVFVNKTNGNFGIGYNIDGMAEADGSPTSPLALGKIAKENCGTTGCELLSENAVEGWLGLISGQVTGGKVLFAVSYGNITKDLAEADVRMKYKADGGTNADNIGLTTVYVYTTSHKAEAAEVKGFDVYARDGQAFDNLLYPPKKKITGGGAGKTAGASFDGGTPYYTVTTSNVKAVEAKYMKLIVAMTTAPATKTQLLKDHNDLKSYQEIERKSERSLVELRRGFIKYLHGTYNIPYPEQ
jgi:hypothetical protein